MDLSSFFPPSDLLERVRGVESGLRQRRKVSGAAAVVSILISAIYLAAAVKKEIGSLGELLRDPVLLGLAAAFFVALVLSWSRFWLRVSRHPFRYTCSIGTFEPVETPDPPDDTPGPRDDIQRWMRWMPHDMTCLLNERVQRFFFAEQSSGDEPYIHVRAHWVVRMRPKPRAEEPEVKEIEIMPRVRLGPPNSPEVMAQSTVFTLPKDTDRAAYEELLEQVYHSVVTEVYQQLKGDVAAKIRLLPTSKHRAIALLFEADDYARSNTLHAYEEAAQLYLDTAAICDPAWRPSAETALPRVLRGVRCATYLVRALIRRIEALYRPSVLELDLIGGRAMAGYARMTLFTRMLRTLAGQKAHPRFDATPIARQAVRRIQSMSRDTPGYGDALFDAQVTLALGEWHVGNVIQATGALKAARALSPQKAEHDAAFMLASGLVSPDGRTRLVLYKRMVDRAPRSEVAQYCLASEAEKLWRDREKLEHGVAALVLTEYDRLRTLNPSNLAAYSHPGYVYWLLGDNKRAREMFEQGRRFKTARKELYIAELDYGLARIEAEQGDFKAAYPHYLSAASSLPGGIENDFRSHFFQEETPTIQRRLGAYYREVRKHVRAIPKDDAELVRIGNSIHAFALNDVGEAYLAAAGLETYFFDQRRVRTGIRALKRATKVNPAFLLPYGTLTRVLPDEEEAIEYARRGLAIDPSWLFGKASVAAHLSRMIPDIPKLEKEIEEKRKELGLLARQTLSYAGRERQNDLEKEIATGEEKLVKARNDVQTYREEALDFVRELLPQEWLWKGTALRLGALRNRAYRTTYRWERELNVSQVFALTVWARCFATDARRLPEAVAVYEHIRNRFWPNSTADLIAAKLRQTGDERRPNDIIEQELARTPAAAVSLAWMGTPLTKKQLSDADEGACRWDSDYRRLRSMKERRSRAYAMVAAQWSGSDDSEALYRKAMELSVYGEAHAELAGELETRAASASGEEAAAFLERAVAAAEEAVRREPKNRGYQRQHTAVKWTRQFGSAAAALLKSPQRLCIEISAELVDWGEELVPASQTVRREVLGALFPPIHISDPLTSPRQFRVLIDRQPVVDEQLPDTENVVARIMEKLAFAIRAHIQDFLRIDDIVLVLGREHLGELDRLHDDGLIPELAVVLRALAAERIPLPPLMPIVRVFRQAYDPSRTFTEVYERVRSHPTVQKRIAALQTDAGVVVVRVDTPFEDAIRQEINARGSMGPDSKITDDLRRSVSASFAAQDPAATHRLLVCTPELRPSIMQLVEGSVERLTVASDRQVAPNVLRRAARMTTSIRPAQEETP